MHDILAGYSQEFQGSVFDFILDAVAIVDMLKLEFYLTWIAIEDNDESAW